jgi:hypothetical protein
LKKLRKPINGTNPDKNIVQQPFNDRSDFKIAHHWKNVAKIRCVWYNEPRYGIGNVLSPAMFLFLYRKVIK